MEMIKENKKQILIFTIITLSLILITVVLSLLLNNNKNKAEKILIDQDYIIEKETKYSELHGKMPFINLKGKEIEKINNEILSNYYSTVSSKDNIYIAKYHIYKDILSLFITISLDDGSEYGNIKYYSYNVNVKTGNVMSNKDLHKYLDLKSTTINEKIENKLKSYYEKDSLKKELTFEEYKETLNYKEDNNRLVIKEDNTLYCYNSLGLTHDLISYQGNKNEIMSIKLK